MDLKDILKRRAIPIILASSIGGLNLLDNKVVANAEDIETSIVLEEDMFGDKMEYELEEQKNYYINEEYLEIRETGNEVLYSSALIGSTIGLIAVKNKLKKKKMK